MRDTEYCDITGRYLRNLCCALCWQKYDCLLCVLQFAATNIKVTDFEFSKIFFFNYVIWMTSRTFFFLSFHKNENVHTNISTHSQSVPRKLQSWCLAEVLLQSLHKVTEKNEECNISLYCNLIQPLKSVQFQILCKLWMNSATMVQFPASISNTKAYFNLQKS